MAELVEEGKVKHLLQLWQAGTYCGELPLPKKADEGQEPSDGVEGGEGDQDG